MFKKKVEDGVSALSKAVGGVVQEDKNKPLYNKVFRLPVNIIKEINQFIDQGYKGRAIRKVMEKYKGKYDIPTNVTLDKYRKWYEDQKNKKPEAQLRQLIQKDAQGTHNEVANIDSYAGKDKKDILEDMILRIDRRMRLIEQSIKDSPDFAFDRMFAVYMRETRTILETLAKLSGELKDEKTTIVNIVHNQVDFIFQWFVDILKQKVPEKAEDIQEELLKKINQYQQSSEESHG